MLIHIETNIDVKYIFTRYILFYFIQRFNEFPVKFHNFYTYLQLVTL